MTDVVAQQSPAEAPGAPGIDPTWTSSAKDMVGCGLGCSRLWFTVGYGIVNEVYYPRIDIPQIRDLGFIIADGRGFWVEVKRLHAYRLDLSKPGVPAVEVSHRHPRFELRLRIAPDPDRDALLVDVALHGDETLRPYVLLAPHLGGTGLDNYAEVAAYRGRRLLWAEQGPFGLALAASDASDALQREAFRQTSAGYVGASDGWQDFARHGSMTWSFQGTGPGNVALMGELPRRACLALGFGSSKESAATLALSALSQPFQTVWNHYIQDWVAWHRRCRLPPNLPPDLHREFMVSAMVLRCHQDRTYPGAMVASLSVPWGNARDDVGGYHLVWPRDLVESAGALLAIGAEEEARSVLRYLIATQHPEGQWSQNQWLGGKEYWKGIQLDETAFPVLLAAALKERDALDGIQVGDMVRRALRFIVLHGPSSEEDRWEEDAGINAFTLAVCIAALVCGATFLEPDESFDVLLLADDWNAHIEQWTTVADTPMARREGVDRYYVRVAPRLVVEQEAAFKNILPIKNRTHDYDLPAEAQVGVDFLQLVRFGLRRADDPVVVDTLKLVDALLRADTPNGPSWHRYSGDGYGEHADGTPFDGTGQGRLWPLLTGERGHYVLAAGGDAVPFLRAMAAMANDSGLVPEQIWDSSPIPEVNLYPGRPSGSAMPLVWAHAEFIKLCASLELGRSFDRPAAVWERYRARPPAATHSHWTVRSPITRLAAGTTLRICLTAPCTVRWGVDGWQHPADAQAREGGLELYYADLPTHKLLAGQYVDFALRWADGLWEGQDFRVTVTNVTVGT